MITIEKITYGYILEFKNTEQQKVKIHFPNFDDMSNWLKLQIDTERK